MAPSLGGIYISVFISFFILVVEFEVWLIGKKKIGRKENKWNSITVFEKQFLKNLTC